MKNTIQNLILGIFAGIIIAGSGIIYADYFSSFILWYISLFIISIFMFIISMIIHELGHMTFGILTGYKFLSIRFGSYMFVREENGIKLKRFSLAGTGGQCLMEPPELINNQIPFVLYNMGGCIMNLIVCIPALIVIIINQLWLIDYIMSLFIGLNIISALMNGIPLKTREISNDGYNTLMLSKDKECIISFYKQMKIAALNHKNIRLKDMDESLFVYSSLDNPLLQVVAIFKANRLLDMHQYDECRQLIEYLLSHCPNMIGVYKHLLINDLIYLLVIHNEDPSSLLTQDHIAMRKALKNMLSIIRTDYIYHKYYTKDLETMNKTYKLFNKICETYPYESEKESEKELMGK